MYKWCVVPECTNSTIKTPEKLFVHLPKKKEIRKKWLQLARRDPNSIADNSVVYFCEDHFNIDKDMTNYYQFKMGFSHKILMVDGVMPSKFHCQLDRKRMCVEPSTSQSGVVKRQRIQLLQECEDIPPKAIVQDTLSELPSTTGSLQVWDKSTCTEPIFTADKSVQCNYNKKVNFRSKAMQTKPMVKDAIISPYKHSTSSSYTSPFKIQPWPHTKASTSGNVNIKRRIGFADEERSESDSSVHTEVAKQQDSSSFTVASSSKISDSSTTVEERNADIDKLKCTQHTLSLIVRKPLLYLGISKECYYIVHLIHKHTNIPHEYILLCLRKIRLNSSFSELADNFGLLLSYASKLFLKNIPLMASVLRPFIVDINNYSIKKTLPVPFRHNYYNVSCIIDCMGNDIQKPSKALFQALTWSDYKKGNTVKFLISCTPNGLVNYISPGFGGRASDVTILENCEFLDCLEPGNFVLADRGFKHVEQVLDAKEIKLLRPPSVASGSKLSKAEVRQTKIIASLRIHVERVIRRLREFHMLKQHSVINKIFLRILNDVVVIACALINI